MILSSNLYPRFRWGGLAVLALGMALVPLVAQAPQAGKTKAKKPKGPKPMYAHIVTSKGTIICELLPKSAPKTVENFVGLAKGTKRWINPKSGGGSTNSLYNGTIFHRVIPNFMIQGGDPLGNGTGGPGYKFEDEFDSSQNFNQPGVLAMANAGPNTNGSQFFITVAPTPHLHMRHSIFGKVVKGQDVADAISLVPKDGSDRPLEPVALEKVLIKDKI